MKYRNAVLGSTLVLAMAAVSPTTGGAQLGEKLKRALKGLDPKSGTEEGAVSGPKALDQNGLRDILPQWDPRKDTSEQFPHVAVTVLKAPSMWADPAYVDQLKRQSVPGCFTLQLRVWADETNSKVVGPFDWCAPRDLEVTPGTLGDSKIISAGLTSGSMTKAEERYQTGLTRTEGPRPPDTITPNDPVTANFVRKNNQKGSSRELSVDTDSRFGMMFFNLRVGMGQRFDHTDRRVWIVEIRDPSRPEPLVASGTLSSPLQPSNIGKGGGPVESAPGGPSQGQLVDSHAACPTNPKVMDKMKTYGNYQCINGTLWAPKPPAFEQFGNPALANNALAIGDVVLPKIANVKLLAEPREDARVVRTLAKTDELVVAAMDTNGFSKVEGSSGSGWVKTVMIGKR